MKKEIFDYKLTREERLLAHVINYAVGVNDEMAEGFAGVISPTLIYADFKAKRTKAVEYRRKIDFPRLLELTEQSVKMLRQLNVKAVLQNAGTEFYDFLVDCCK